MSTKMLVDNKSLLFKKCISLSMFVCLLVTESFTMTGCGRKINAEIPKLNEPAASTLSFRPVTKRHIGNVEILMGVVRPAKYTCIPDNPVTISSIEVKLGDYVEKGQIVAKADTSDYDEQLSELNKNIEELNDQRKCREEVSEQQIKILEFQKKECKEKKDKTGMKSADNEIALEKENLRYDLSVIDNNIDEAKKNITAINEEIAGLTFTAPHDGFVSYVAPVDEGSNINAGENIVVISDDSELIVETDEVAVSDYMYDSYKSKWAYLDGEKISVTEYKFTDDELEQSRNTGIYPPMRFVIQENDLGLSAGMTVPLYFVKGEYRECLSVGNDSVYKEDDSAYVYVKGDNDELVRRTVTLGETDKYYSEVIDGLNEGEKVFYENNSIVPGDSSSAEVEMSDYSEELTTQYYETAFTTYNIYLSPCNGVIDSESIVKAGEKVYAGDDLFGISTVTGKAELYEAKLAVDNLDEQHKQAEENYRKQIKLLDKELKKLDIAAGVEPGNIILANMNDMKEIKFEEKNVLGVGENEAYAENEADTEKAEGIKNAKSTEQAEDTKNEKGIKKVESTKNAEDKNNADGTEKTDGTEQSENKDKVTSIENADNKKNDKTDESDQKETVQKTLEETIEKTTEETQNEIINDIEKDIIKCEKKILDIERKYENTSYKRDRELLLKKYNELSGAGGKDGCTYIKAAADGVMGQIISAGSGAVSKGEMITVTGQLSDDVILVKMRSSSGGSDGSSNKPANIGQQVMVNNGNETFTGKCVGEKAAGSSSQFYVRLDNAKISDIEKRVTDAADITSDNKEDDDLSMNNMGKDAVSKDDLSKDDKIVISFDGTRMNSVITIPKKALYTETDSLTQQKSDYVWKLIDNIPVKEYVLVLETSSNSEKAVILSGLEAGDIVVSKE